MPFLPTLIGWSSCPMESGMKAGSPMPVSISITWVVCGLAIVRVLAGLQALGGLVNRRRQIDSVLVELRKTSRQDPRRNDVAEDGASLVEAVVLAHEDVLHVVDALLLI